MKKTLFRGQTSENRTDNVVGTDRKNEYRVIIEIIEKNDKINCTVFFN